MLLIANPKLAKLTVHYSKYEHVWERQVHQPRSQATPSFHHLQYPRTAKLGGAREWGYKFIVYKFPVQFTGIFCYLQVTSLQYTLQQIVVTYKSLTNQRAIILFHCWQSVFNQSVSYYTVCMYKKNMPQHYSACGVNGAGFFYGLWLTFAPPDVL